MNIVYRDNQVDIYITSEEVEELKESISLDLKRILIALEKCEGCKDVIVKLLEDLNTNLSFDMISLTDDYVAININMSKSSSTEITPNLVIMKRNMREIYFLQEIDTATVIDESSFSQDKILKEYSVRHYTWYNDQLKAHTFIHTETLKSDTNPALLQTDEFVAKLELQNMDNA